MSSELTDFFQAGPAIQARLRDLSQAIGLKTVDDLAPLADALEGAKPGEIAQRLSALYPQAPAVAVGYDGDVILMDGDGGGQVLAQRWLVVLVVRNVADTRAGAALMREAGPILLALAAALGGWRPDVQYLGDLRRVAGPRPSFGPGIGLFPLAFAVPVYLPGANL